MNLKLYTGLLCLVSLSLSCGGSDSGSDYVSVSSAKPAQLSPEQKNALSTLSKYAGKSGTSAAQGTTQALVRSNASSGDSERMFPASQAFDSESFESSPVNCSVSGTTQASGNFSGNFSSESSGSFSLKINADLLTQADNCRSEEALVDGEITSELSLVISLQVVESNEETEFKGSSESIVFLDGEFEAEGLNEDDELKKVSVSYNNLRLRTSFDLADSEAYAGFQSIYEEDASDDDRVEFLRENLSCSGSVSVDGEEFDCASIFARLLESEA